MSVPKVLTFEEIEKHKVFFAALPQAQRVIFEEQIQSVKHVLDHPSAYSDAELLAKAESLKEIVERLEIAYEASESSKAMKAMLREL